MSYSRSFSRCSAWAYQRNGDYLAQQYAGSAAFHKAQVDKINGGWTTVKQSIALVAVKRSSQ